METRVIVCSHCCACAELVGPAIGAAHIAASGEEAVRLCRRVGKSVVLMDLGHPRGDMFAAARAITRGGSSVVAFGDVAARGWIRRVLDGGLSGFLDGEATVPEFQAAVRAAAKGDRYFSPVSARIVAEFAAPKNRGSALSERERKVLQLMNDGRTSKQISRILGIRSKTIDAIRARLMVKTGSSNATSLVRYACNERFVDLRPRG